MKKMRLITVLLLAVPFAAFSASLEPAAVSGSGPAGALEEPESQYQCCWIFYMGQWFCVPC